MNADKQEAVALLNGLLAQYEEFGLSEHKLVMVAPPFPYIHYCASLFSEYSYMYAAAQNCSEHVQGAYTGEVSARIIASLGVNYVIIGHSERRQYFQESADMLHQKLQRAMEQELIPVFCCGEPLSVRKQGGHFDWVKVQLEDSLFKLDAEQLSTCVIAYEPVWAIGTGVTATPEQAQEMHHYIRQLLAARYALAGQVSILYGGSVNAGNAAELFACPDIDGGLVGGASLKAAEFAAIIRSMK